MRELPWGEGGRGGAAAHWGGVVTVGGLEKVASEGC